MDKLKKGPMYESVTSPNETKSYDFVDYTSPKHQKTPTVNYFQKDFELAKRIQSVYRSQLLNIEESKEEDNHLEDLERELLKPKNKESTIDNKQNQQLSFRPFNDLLRGQRDFGSFNENNLNFEQHKYRINLKNNPMSSYTKKSSQQNVLSGFKRSNSSYFNINSQFTSDQIISLLPNPYRSNLEMLKSRVKYAIPKIL